MRKLFIHCGMHKTGSSAIQLSLRKNKRKLKDNGWEVLSDNPTGNSSRHVKVFKEGDCVETKVTDNFFDLIKNSETQKAIISAEHLSIISSEEEIKRVRDRAKEWFDQVEIIFYLRRQDKLAVSFKAQASKMLSINKLPSSLLMGHRLSALPEINAGTLSYFDYYSKIRLWADFFGKEKINVRVYEKNKLIDGDVCSDFSNVLNLPFRLPEIKTNSSLQRRNSLVCHYLLGKGYPPKLINYVKRNIKDDGERILPSQREAVSFLESFKISNEHLLNYLGYSSLFEGELSEYPEESNFQMRQEDYDELIKTVAKYKV